MTLHVQLSLSRSKLKVKTQVREVKGHDLFHRSIAHLAPPTIHVEIHIYNYLPIVTIMDSPIENSLRPLKLMM